MAGLPDRGIRGSLRGCSGWIRCMSFGTKCWWRGGRSGRSRESWGSRGRHGPASIVDQAAPVRKAEAAPRPRPVWDAVAERVQALLAESVRWTGGKQRLTATRLHELLVAEGHRVGVTVVKDAVAEWKRQRREVFVPLTYRPGDLAEVDFFEVLVDVDGIRRKAWLFLMRLMYSGRDFAWIYERQDQISFLDGHVRAFAHFDGVPARVAYDNLRAAVVRILVGGARTLTPRFAALASHYLLEACFCRPGEGHDKGGVESRGKAVRQQALVPIPVGADARGHQRDAAGADGCAARHHSAMRPARPSACASPRSSATVRRAPDAVRAGGDDVRDGVAARAGAARGRRLLGAESLGRARSGRAHRRDDRDHRRPRRDADSASAQAVWAAVDRLPALPVGARAQAAGGAPGAAGSPARSRATRFRRSGISSTRRTGRGRPRGSSPKSSASSTRTARRSSCPR